MPKCGRGLRYRDFGTPHRGKGRRAESYTCVKSAASCGGVAVKADLLEEYVTGAVLGALELARVQQALREGVSLLVSGPATRTLRSAGTSQYSTLS